MPSTGFNVMGAVVIREPPRVCVWQVVAPQVSTTWGVARMVRSRSLSRQAYTCRTLASLSSDFEGEKRPQAFDLVGSPGQIRTSDPAVNR